MGDQRPYVVVDPEAGGTPYLDAMSLTVNGVTEEVDFIPVFIGLPAAHRFAEANLRATGEAFEMVEVYFGLKSIDSLSAEEVAVNADVAPLTPAELAAKATASEALDTPLSDES